MTVKFNNGNPVIICDKCRVIIRFISNHSEPDNVSHYCSKCFKKSPMDLLDNDYREEGTNA